MQGWPVVGAGHLLPFRVGARGCPMGSLIEELRRHEAAARQEADELRGEIARLNERLARAEERLSRLEITREMVAEILGGAGTGQPAPAAAGLAPVSSRLAGG